MLVVVRFWTILPILSVFLTIYFTFLQTNINTLKSNRNLLLFNNVGDVKKIVAFSLNKQIELDSEEVFCDKKTINWRKIVKLINNNVWTNVIDTNLYVYSVHFDRRLDPYHFLRIVGVVEGIFLRKLIRNL